MTVWPWRQRTTHMPHARGYCVCNSHGYREYSTEFQLARRSDRLDSSALYCALFKPPRRASIVCVVVIVSVGERSIVAGHSQARCGVCSRCPATAATATHLTPDPTASVALRFCPLDDE